MALLPDSQYKYKDLIEVLDYTTWKLSVGNLPSYASVPFLTDHVVAQEMLGKREEGMHPGKEQPDWLRPNSSSALSILLLQNKKNHRNLASHVGKTWHPNTSCGTVAPGGCALRRP